MNDLCALVSRVVEGLDALVAQLREQCRVADVLLAGMAGADRMPIGGDVADLLGWPDAVSGGNF
jgi:hypothetical protein